MNLVVVLRLMANLGKDLELDPSGADIDRDAVGWSMNEWDSQALEQAILLKEATGANVTAVALQSAEVRQLFWTAHGRGADRSVVIEGGEIAPFDSRLAASTLAEAMRELAPDLVLVGVQTPSDVFGQVGPFLATALGWPHVNVVTDVRLSAGTARVQQEYAGGRASLLDVTLPAVLGIQSSSSPPRYVLISRMRQAMATPADTVSVRPVRPSVSPTLVALRRPEHRSTVTMFVGTSAQIAAQIADVLRVRRVLEV
jgi:electron transfer flavoprotein beta subunit